MKMLKSKGPSMEPWGTPDVIFLHTLKESQRLYQFLNLFSQRFPGGISTFHSELHMNYQSFFFMTLCKVPPSKKERTDY